MVVNRAFSQTFHTRVSGHADCDGFTVRHARLFPLQPENHLGKLDNVGRHLRIIEILHFFTCGIFSVLMWLLFNRLVPLGKL